MEGVLIPTEKRYHRLCFFPDRLQPYCAFCATGKMDRKRNLDFDEIYDQVALLNDQCEKVYGKKLSNIVYMGMGEPLLNYKNVLKSIDKITSSESMNMSRRRITVSTAGVAKMIKQLGDDEVRFNLAVSLHAPLMRKRNEIMPINESNNIEFLIESLNYFYQKTKNEITLEYILFKDRNDSIKDAENLLEIYRQVPTHLINVIEYNPIANVSFMKPEEDVHRHLLIYLMKHKVNVRVRRSRGKDIDAACGQLANKDN